MEQELLSATETPEPKTRKPRQAKSNPEGDIAELQAQVALLTEALEKLAGLTGNSNWLVKMGLKRWNPAQEDMKRFKD